MLERYLPKLWLPWLLISCLCLILPIFLPSWPNPQSFSEDMMGTSTAIMFILSFPLSVLGIPAMLFVSLVTDMRPIQAAYLNLLFLFALGMFQWFWIVPRMLRNNKRGLQVLDLNADTPAPALGEAHISTDFSFFDSDSKTPVERVIDDYRER